MAERSEDDIVQVLRDLGAWGDPRLDEAADEIELLRAMLRWIHDQDFITGMDRFAVTEFYREHPDIAEAVKRTLSDPGREHS